MYKKILVPTDGSEFAKKAQKHALFLAEISGAEIIAISVTENNFVNGLPLDDEVYQLNQILKERSEENLKEFDVLKRAWEIQPEKYEDLILLNGIGPKKIRALALISDLIYGEKASWKDAVKYSFTHGGKDGFPHPVNKEVYDHSITTMRNAIDEAKIKKDLVS